MITRIAFPTPSSVDVRTFPDMKSANKSLSEIAIGSVYILAEVTEATLRVLTLAQMVAIYNEGSEEPVKTLSSKKDAAQRILHLIPELAEEANIMAEKKEQAAKNKPAPKKDSKGKGGKSGRTSGLAGKKLHKTGLREEKETGHKTSRRSVSYSKIKNGMTYEAALKAGAHKDDIAKLIWRKHIEAR